MSDSIETFDFQTEARQLLDLMIHSVYSNKEIFLRELISNSSDALDKRRFLAVTDPEAIPAGTELQIFIEADAEARTLSVSDNGIGMSREEVTDLIGTIARSGTRQFLDALQAREDALTPDLIGQFGVGFYSCFMVADKVTLVTRRVGEEQAVKWESAGEGTYTLQQAERPEAGTTVTLHLKPADTEEHIEDYTSEWVIKRLVKKYSDFVAYPIRMNCEHRSPELDDEGKPKPDGEDVVTVELETLNSMKAIWLRDPSEVEEDEYKEFYKHISHDWGEPLERIQAKIEGTLEYRMLLFIPTKAPFDLFSRDNIHGIHLYVRRVFIMDDCKVLLPEYLRFMRGVVDSEDLSLNISREMLQQDRQIQRIRKGVVNKVLDTLAKMRDERREQYTTFWREFGRVLKEGVFQDRDNQAALLDLLLLESTGSPDALTSLKEYADRMPEGQDVIYYMTGESRAMVEHSPHLEAFGDRGHEVLLLTDPVDEVWLQSVFEYGGKPLKSVGKGAVDLAPEEDKEAAEEERKEVEEKFASLFECLQHKLDDHVKEVRLSNRLTSSLACLVGEEHDMSPQLVQMMRAMNQDVPVTKRILELNPTHPVLARLHEIFEADHDDDALDQYAQLLYGLAVLAEGGQLPDPGAFSKLVADLSTKAI
ncbi:MAG: molecular chaperone HtpG [Nitrospiraceae bacterium]|nr:molecular chaperone HtpG [Nitrospiraceae bacterium]